MSQTDFQFTLQNFQGPLDLLLHLIRRAEVDIHDIPIASITDQFLRVVRDSGDVDVEHAGEFLLMASTLIEIKSRTLTPEPPPEDRSERRGETEDPRHELVRQLLAYQRYRVASETLERRAEEFALRVPARPFRPARSPDADDEPPPLDIEDLHILDLSHAYERIAAAIDFDRLHGHEVEFDDTPIELHQDDLIDRLGRTRARRLALQEAFHGMPPVHRIGLFLATLELVRQRRVDVVQNDVESDIVLVLRPDPPEPEEPDATQPDAASDTGGGAGHVE